MKRNKPHSLLFLFLLLPLLVIGQEEKAHRVKVHANQAELLLLSNAGVAVDHGTVKRGYFIITDLWDKEVEIVKGLGLKYEILIEDVAAFYKARNENPEVKSGNATFADHCEALDYTTPSNFNLGSLSGYFTYSEFLAEVDQMVSLYPNLISPKDSISNYLTVEGRPIHWLRISDNPNIDELEPEILYTSLHHSREPASLSQQIFYMWYLLENYGTNDIVTQLVDNTELYFVPCVNPDGYRYVETNNIMWRKNRRNTGVNVGVDLNRNYGYEWGYDNTGSSPSTGSDTYRGDSAFSEIETQAIKYLCENHNFSIAINNHTYGNLLIYPWGYLQSYYTPDSAQFAEYGRLMTKYNSYAYGTGDQTVGYVTNGDSDDWMYGEQGSKNKILSFTPEAGPDADGFWPVASKIIPLCNFNIYQNLMAAKLVGKYAVVEDKSPLAASSSAGYFHFDITRYGMASPATYVVSIVPVGVGLAMVGPAASFPALSILQTERDSISYTLDAALQNGDYFSYVLQIDNGQYIERDTITKMYVGDSTALADPGTTTALWTGGAWGINSSIYHSPPSSITDSPSGLYPNNTTNEITLVNPIDLRLADAATLSFWAKWSIELAYDYAQVMISTDGGVAWTPLCGLYTVLGNADQDPGQPLYHGFRPEWVQDYFDLTEFVGNEILIRFRMVSDFGVQEDGFYFDDLEVVILRDDKDDVAQIVESNSDFGVGQVMPNPASNFTRISYQLRAENTADIVVHNAAGQEVFRTQLTEKEGVATLNTSGWNAGLYFSFLEVGGTLSKAERFSVIR